MVDVLKALQSISDAIRDGDDVDCAEIEEILARGRSTVEQATEEEIRRLLQIVDQLETQVRDRFEEVGDELQRLGQGRQALKGYNHIRSLSEGQRLYRRA